MAKYSIRSSVDVRWLASTCRVFSQTSLSSIVWWQSYLSSFPVSVASKVSWSHTNGLLAVGICENHSVSVSFANCVWFERCHQNCDSRDSYCHGTCCSTIHHLPHAKCHRVWRRSYGKFVKHNHFFYDASLSFFVVLTFSLSNSGDFRKTFAVWTLFGGFHDEYHISVSKNWVLPFGIFKIFSL